jgi:hypothetical protein
MVGVCGLMASQSAIYVPHVNQKMIRGDMNFRKVRRLMERVQSNIIEVLNYREASVEYDQTAANTYQNTVDLRRNLELLEALDEEEFGHEDSDSGIQEQG